MKLSASKFEKQIDYKYNNLINQNEDKDKKFAVTKLKRWINGIYLDNILLFRACQKVRYSNKYCRN